MIEWLKKKFNCINDKVFPEIKYLVDKIEDNQKVLARMQNLLEDEREKIEYELAFYKGFAELLLEESPDMIWLKDMNGKYMIANTAIKTGLLFDYHPYGKNDIELSTNAKNKFGSDNHTFGEICGNSDDVIIETLKAQRFLESGKVKGKTIYLEVFKFPFYVDGVLIGIGGIGRDMTDYVEAYRSEGCNNNCSKMTDIFAKYEFKG